MYVLQQYNELYYHNNFQAKLIIPLGLLILLLFHIWWICAESPNISFVQDFFLLPNTPNK